MELINVLQLPLLQVV